MTNTILVNKNNPMKKSYLKKVNLIEITDINNKNITIDQETYNAYKNLQIFLKSKGIEIAISSAYRTKEEQEQIYEDFIIKYGIDYANKIIDPTGYSEHHTGLALDIDLIIEDHLLISNKELTEQEQIYKEIHKHISDFGFILRYPKGKEHITGYPYEPRHIRYVGKFVAKIIYEKNYTLEEYLKDFRGIILVNKEKNMTSFDVVNKISKLFGIKKVGHTGTLDPLAEGVLIVAIGQATKIVELLTSTYKEYIAGVLLGVKTDTLDITGKVIDSKIIPNNLNLEDTINSFKKTYMQEVPIYSAVKVNGKKLYEYARQNKPVELPKREVTIKEIELISSDKNTFLFKSLVSKGCYIRSLINDIGIVLNTYATMTTLRRIKQGKITIEKTNTLKEIETYKYKIYDIDEVLDYPVVQVEKETEQMIATGRRLKNKWNIEDKVIFKNNNSKLLGIYQRYNEDLKVWKNFV